MQPTANPLHILIAIVILCALTMGATIVLAMAGHESLVPVVVGVSAPVLIALVGLKVDIVRRQLTMKINGVMTDLRSETVQAKEEAAKARGEIKTLKQVVVDQQSTVGQLQEQLLQASPPPPEKPRG